VCEELLAPLLERSRQVLATGVAPTDQLREFMHVWLAHVASHRYHMIVFERERNAPEKGPGWTRIRKRREEFVGLLDEILIRGERDRSMQFEDRRLSLLSVLGMVNYTPHWLNPCGRLSAREIADRYCDFVLAIAVPTPSHTGAQPARSA
jgi:TetR/AcrR family transcriptional regulator, cholesterol catabolism regulator